MEEEVHAQFSKKLKEGIKEPVLSGRPCRRSVKEGGRCNLTCTPQLASRW